MEKDILDEWQVAPDREPATELNEPVSKFYIEHITYAGGALSAVIGGSVPIAINMYKEFIAPANVEYISTLTDTQMFVSAAVGAVIGGAATYAYMKYKQKKTNATSKST
jgi:hypothetical protein